MKILILMLLFVSNTFAQDSTCFESTPGVEPVQSSFCLKGFGFSQAIKVTIKHPEFESQTIDVVESHRGRTVNGDPQFIYAPARIQDGRNLLLTIRCADEYGIYFSAELQDGLSRKTIFATAKGFNHCLALWSMHP